MTVIFGTNKKGHVLRQISGYPWERMDVTLAQIKKMLAEKWTYDDRYQGKTLKELLADVEACDFIAMHADWLLDDAKHMKTIKKLIKRK